MSRNLFCELQQNKWRCQGSAYKVMFCATHYQHTGGHKPLETWDRSSRDSLCILLPCAWCRKQGWLFAASSTRVKAHSFKCLWALRGTSRICDKDNPHNYQCKSREKCLPAAIQCSNAFTGRQNDCLRVTQRNHDKQLEAHPQLGLLNDNILLSFSFSVILIKILEGDES